MHMPLTEPTAPRYIYINPDNNQVHLLVPVVGGQEISTDNTCKSTASLDEFFTNGAALRELNTYKSKLEFDLLLLSDDDSLKADKQGRLEQIDAYIKAVTAMKGSYSAAISQLMQQSSNLYSMQLRPRAQDTASKVTNPVFSMNRLNDAQGEPLSALYNALYEAFPNVTLGARNPKAQLNEAVLKALPAQPDFEAIQRALTEQCQRLFGLTVNFTQSSDGAPVNQASIENALGYEPGAEPLTTEDYMHGLLGACALNIWEIIPTPPFYSVRDNADKTEKLSILTQFFLANVNIYCAANGISRENFGIVLDKSPDLSEEVAQIVFSALTSGAPVEESLCAFFNAHVSEFGLSRPLTQADDDAIQQKFESTYRTVTGTAENPHTDDFMVLDTATQTGKFVTHQGSICTDFSVLVADTSLDNAYFQSARANFEQPHDRYIPPKNERIQMSIEVNIEELVLRVDDEQFKKLPPKIQFECLKSPAFQLRTFLHDVAKGNQDKAKKLLIDHPERTQALLTTPGTFTDYSARTFNCTAYEYAYWAKDTHMRRMLEPHMDEATKVAMRTRIDGIERDGLTYSQHGAEINSKHFDLSKLTTALQNYVDGYYNWEWTSNSDAMKAAWMQVGLAQRDVPVHVMNEYCRPDRSFVPVPPALKLEFDEASLPRVLTFYNYAAGSDYAPVFPLDVSGIAGLGFEFSLFRDGDLDCPGSTTCARWAPEHDLAAISRLDEVRTADLTQSRENLGLIAQEPDHGLRPY